MDTNGTPNSRCRRTHRPLDVITYRFDPADPGTGSLPIESGTRLSCMVYPRTCDVGGTTDRVYTGIQGRPSWLSKVFGSQYGEVGASRPGSIHALSNDHSTPGTRRRQPDLTNRLRMTTVTDPRHNRPTAETRPPQTAPTPTTNVSPTSTGKRQLSPISDATTP
jgi:hypothetical protein